MTKAKQKTTRGADIAYGRADNMAGVIAALKIDTSDLPQFSMTPLDVRKPAYAHLDSRKWRRDDRRLVPVVSNLPGDNLETRHLRKLKPVTGDA